VEGFVAGVRSQLPPMTGAFLCFWKRDAVSVTTIIVYFRRKEPKVECKESVLAVKEVAT
jgi:hypothetical protein